MSKSFKLYTRFKKLPQNAYHEFCLLYKSHQFEISQMDFMEYVEIKYNYVKALYFIDEYSTMQKEADLLLEEILNYKNFDEAIKSFYLLTILWKAKAYLNSNQRIKSIAAYKALVKLVPDNKSYKRTLFSLLYQTKNLNGKKILAWVVLLLLISLVLNALLILFINPFYPEYQGFLEWIRNGLFGGGFLLFLTLQLTHICEACKEMNRSQ